LIKFSQQASTSLDEWVKAKRVPSKIWFCPSW